MVGSLLLHQVHNLPLDTDNCKKFLTPEVYEKQREGMMTKVVRGDVRASGSQKVLQRRGIILSLIRHE